jgi:hypothetical protein
MIVRFSVSANGCYSHAEVGDCVVFPMPVAHIRAWKNGRLRGAGFLDELFRDDPVLYVLDECEMVFSCGAHATFTLYGTGGRVPVEADTVAMEATGLKVQVLHFFVDEDVTARLRGGGGRELWERIVNFMEN